jgi:hypothetical protein
MTDLDIYQPAAVAGYQPGMVMDEKAARALDEQVRRCTQAVLREGTDYGHIPGTSGDEKSLWRPGAQKLLQWFGLGYTCERVEVERDDDGRKHGITYKCTVARRLPDGTLDIKATCEGTADYDESKFYQTAEEVQRKAKDRETRNAEKYRRPRNPEKWQDLPEYRADWNALMKRAQKRAIVGAVVDATAAGGIFTDREEDESPVPQDDGPSGRRITSRTASATAASCSRKPPRSTLRTSAARPPRSTRKPGRPQMRTQKRKRAPPTSRPARPPNTTPNGTRRSSASSGSTSPASATPPRPKRPTRRKPGGSPTSPSSPMSARSAALPTSTSVSCRKSPTRSPSARTATRSTSC